VVTHYYVHHLNTSIHEVVEVDSMPSDRPYSGMTWDDLEKRVQKVEHDFIRELVLISDELEHRTVPSARDLSVRLQRKLDFFARGGY
jgi:hypothetical protein